MVGEVEAVLAVVAGVVTIGSEDASRAGGEVEWWGKVAVVAVSGSTATMGKVCERGRCGYAGAIARTYCGGANGPCVVSGEKEKGVEGLEGPPEKEEPTVVSVKLLDRDVVLREFERRYPLEPKDV